MGLGFKNQKEIIIPLLKQPLLFYRSTKESLISEGAEGKINKP
jgi:hypothetical protein